MKPQGSIRPFKRRYLRMKKSKEPAKHPPGQPKGPGLSSLLKPYRRLIFLLVALSLTSNAINLLIPKIIARGIDSFVGKH